MDENLANKYLNNIKERRKARLKINEKYTELCERNKDLSPDDYHIDNSHSLDEYFDKYSNDLEKGKLLAFKKEELWLMNHDKKYWRIDNDSEFIYFEISSQANLLSVIIPYVTIKNGIVAALCISTITFGSLFVWKATTGIISPGASADAEKDPAPDPSSEIKWKEVTDIELEGSGTKDVPYKISSGRELAGIAELVNSSNTLTLKAGNEPYDTAYYELEDSINLSGKAWTPIGTKSHRFHGTFTTKDNKQLKIIGLTNYGFAPQDIGATIEGYGLFGYTDDAHISNLNLESVNIAYPYQSGTSASFETFEETAAIVGWAKNGLTLKNCKASGLVLTGNNDCVGGLIGKITNNNESWQENPNYIIEDCESSVYVYADRTVKGKDYVRAGGLVGQINMCTSLHAKVLFKNCISNSCIEAYGVTSKTSSFGGVTVGAFAGSVQTGSTVILDNCDNNTNIIKAELNKSTDGITDDIVDIAVVAPDVFFSTNLSDGGGKFYLFNCSNRGEKLLASTPIFHLAYRKQSNSGDYAVVYIKNGENIYKGKNEANFTGWTDQTAPSELSYSVTDGDIVMTEIA